MAKTTATPAKKAAQARYAGGFRLGGMVLLAGFCVWKHQANRPSQAVSEATAMLAEVISAGNSVHGVSASFPVTGRGLAANKNFKKGEVVLRMKSAALGGLGPDAGAWLPWRENIRAAVAGLELNGTKGTKLWAACALLVERALGADSRFFNFIKMLPTEPAAYLGWGSDSLVVAEALGGIPTINEKLKSLREQAEHLRSWLVALRAMDARWVNLRIGKESDEDAARWAISHVDSRAHMLDGSATLFPAMTLMNHNFHPDVHLQWEEKGDDVLMVAPQKIKEGEQLFLSYGTFSNLRLLVQYGFAVDSNPFGELISNAFLTKAADFEIFLYKDLVRGKPDLDCGAIAKDASVVLQKTLGEAAGVPELVLNCMRLGQMPNRTEAKQALDMKWFGANIYQDLVRWLSKSEAGNHTEAHEQIRRWLASDRRVYQTVIGWCGDEAKASWEHGGGALAKIFDLKTPLAVSISNAVSQELDFWKKCKDEMHRRLDLNAKLGASIQLL